MNQQRETRRTGSPEARVVSDAELRQIIVEGDARALVECADRLGRELNNRGLKASQIRRIFGAVREIEMDWPRSSAAPADGRRARDAQRQFLLLEPKIAYQEARNRREVSPLGDVLKPAIRLVEGDRQRFQHFVEFFEATVAYHRAAGGSNS